MLIDFSGADMDALGGNQPVKAALGAHNGDIDNVTVQRLVENGMWRVSFRLQPKNSQGVDLHCYLTLYGEALTETWMYLWTP
jgi:glucans biosynthesis protein